MTALSAPNTLDDLILDAFQTESAQRFQAIDALAHSKHRRAQNALLTLLVDPDPHVADYAAAAVYSGGKQEVVTLLMPLLTDANPILAGSAMRVLVWGGAAFVEAYATLTPVLQHALLPYLFEAFKLTVLRPADTAAQALCAAGDPLVLAPLLVWVRHEEPTQTAAIASVWVGLYGPSAYEQLAALVTDPCTAVRLVAVNGLRQLSDAQAVPLLIARLDDPCLSVQSAAAQALGALRDTGAGAALQHYIQTCTTRTGLNSAYLALEKINPTLAQAALVALDETRIGQAH